MPCESAHIGVCDRIFTRIGASDNLAQGQSTFFVEMSELAYILNTATSRSLVILDEIGRGTSTYDGLSIAWAAAEFLSRPERMIRTLFATHYHEMTSSRARWKAFAISTWMLLRKTATSSFCTRSSRAVPAGATAYTLQSSRERLQSFWSVRRSTFTIWKAAENVSPGLRASAGHSVASAAGPTRTTVSETSCTDDETSVREACGAGCEEEVQLSMFASIPDPVTQRLRDLDLMDTTPSEALRILEELKKYL